MGTVQNILSKKETSPAYDTINYTQQQWQRRENKDFSGEEECELTFVQTDSSFPFLGFLIIREKYKQDPRGSKDKVSVSDDS